MNYIQLQKQATKDQISDSQKLFDAANQKKIDFLGGLSNIGAGAGLGALGGGLVSLLPTSTPKRDRLRRAIMLMVQGGIIGGSMAGIGQYTTGYTLTDAKNGLVSSYKDWKADRGYRKAEQRAKERSEQGEIIA